MNIRDYLISARFFTTLGHFTGLILLFNTIKANVEVSLADADGESDRSTLLSSSYGALSLGIIWYSLHLLYLDFHLFVIFGLLCNLMWFNWLHFVLSSFLRQLHLRFLRNVLWLHFIQYENQQLSNPFSFHWRCSIIVAGHQQLAFR